MNKTQEGEQKKIIDDFSKNKKPAVNLVYSSLLKKFSIYLIVAIALFVTLFVFGIIRLSDFKFDLKKEESFNSRPTREIDHSELRDCSLINNNQDRSYCIYKLAIGAGEPLLCDRVLSGYKQFDCYYKFAIERKEESLCGKIYNDLDSDRCYFGVAKLKNEIEICEQMNLEEKQEECVIFFTANTNDYSVCEAHEDHFKRRVCYENFAVAEEDLSVCENIEDDINQRYCKENAAEKSNNPDQCAKLDYGHDEAYCYERLAINNKDKSYCKNISSTELESVCLKKFTGVNSLAYVTDHFSVVFVLVEPFFFFMVAGLFLISVISFMISITFVKTGGANIKESMQSWFRIGAVPIIDYAVFLILCELYTALATANDYTQWDYLLALGISAHFFTFPLFNLLMKQAFNTGTRENARIFFFYLLGIFSILIALTLLYWAVMIVAFSNAPPTTI